MKFLIIFAVALASCTAFPLENEATLTHRSIELPEQDIGGRITNGNTAAPGQFPYQVGLSIRLSAFTSSWCGGSLIGREWVLTAAHCTENAMTVTVNLGATVRTSPQSAQTVGTTNIIIHNSYNRDTLRNDISLIRISAVTLTSRIQLVKLPAISSVYPSYINQWTIASGWGRTSDSVNSAASNIQWARLEVISNSVCERTYGSPYVVSSNVCVATPRGTSTCQGDSGGPLVLESSKVQIGLTSFGADAGCEKGYPVAFTRVTSYLDWIRSKTGISY